MERKEMLKQLDQMKSKLMGAVAMLLVAAILMGSTSYAWFVLSTAPEVKDLRTTAGANGALEIALQSTNAEGNGRADITSAVGSSVAKVNATVSNTYWGNVVDLSSGYGLEHVTLYPSRLSTEARTVDGQTSYAVLTNSILAAPKFGTDGRLVRLDQASKTHYNVSGESAGKFTDNANWGVNVIGFARNGDEAEDNSFTRAYSRANVLAEATQKVATYRTDLRAEMEDLIERNSIGIFGIIAMIAQIPLVTDEQLFATVSDFVTSMDAIVSEAADAVRWALLANAVADVRYSSESEEDMRALGTIYKEFLQYPMTSEDANVVTVASIAAANGYTEIAEAAAAIATAQVRIDRAARDLNAGSIVTAATMLLKLDESFVYGQHRDIGVADQKIALGLRYDFGEGYTDDTIFTVATPDADPISINLFSSLATVLGDYGAETNVWITLDENDNEVVVDQEPSISEIPWPHYQFGIKATNKSTAAGWTDVSNLDLAPADANIGALGSVYQNVSSKTATGDILMPILRTDITAYGYSVDLAFQASENTSLVLQQEGINRVSDINEDQRLQGAGSTMTFTLPGDLSHEQAQRLLQCIHVVFMNTTTGTIYKVASADAATIDTVLGTATATLQLYEPSFAEDGSLTLGSRVSSNVIADLTKDTPYYITAVVYLNGDLVDSGMFSPNQVLSLDGSVNLQFASSTMLQSMNYSDYYTAPTGNEGN